MKILLLIVVFVAAVTANQWMNDFPSENMATMINNIKTLERQKSVGYSEDFDYPDSSPFKKIIYRQLKLSRDQVIQLPVYIHAKIKRTHLQNLESRSGIPNEIYGYLRARDSRFDDEAGHLLAYSLGGGMLNNLNYAPMALCLNRGPYLKQENEIRAFFNKQRGGEVDWHLVVVYKKNLRDMQALSNTIVNVNNYDLRPIGFCLKYTASANGRPLNVVSKCFHNVLHGALDAQKD